MDKSEIIELGNKYFLYFENKDIFSLKNIYSKKIILSDPIIKEVIGIENVLKVNRDFFKSSEKIKLYQKKIFVDYYTNTMIAELVIHFDKNIVKVIDIIEFNSDKKIIKIKAYFDSK